MADYGFDTGVSWPPPPLLPVDGDGDGWEPPEDCDDDDRDVHPDATEVPYNGVDEDCQDGDLVDVDGDGYSAVEAGGDDCADANASIHPDAEETCGDSRDNNCSGQADEGCNTKDVTNPGGLSWTCAQAPVQLGSGLMLVLGILVALRRLPARG